LPASRSAFSKACEGALCLRDQDVERLRRDAIARDGTCEQQLADLWAVAVHDDKLVVQLKQRQHGPGQSGGDDLLLLRRAPAFAGVERVAADRNDQAARDQRISPHGCSQRRLLRRRGGRARLAASVLRRR